ncbi:Uncharacterized protein Rs2_15106 [Raphanus sativus]|nr:Uncharacterized protein Rs2_15106 [Raphanus sativus]
MLLLVDIALPRRRCFVVAPPRMIIIYTLFMLCFAEVTPPWILCFAEVTLPRLEAAPPRRLRFAEVTPPRLRRLAEITLPPFEVAPPMLRRRVEDARASRGGERAPRAGKRRHVFLRPD